jgi:hypothetical protein
LHKGYARQSQRQLCGEFILWQITLNPVPLFAIFIQHQRGGRPD